MTIMNISLNENVIEKLESKGNRWTKGSFDRIYFNVTDVTSFSYSTYKSGNISSAYIGEDEISNTEAGRITCAKLYVDLKTGDIIIENKGNARKISTITEQFKATIEALITETEETAEEETAETQEAATTEKTEEELHEMLKAMAQEAAEMTTGELEMRCDINNVDGFWEPGYDFTEPYVYEGRLDYSDEVMEEYGEPQPISTEEAINRLAWDCILLSELKRREE